MRIGIALVVGFLTASFLRATPLPVARANPEASFADVVGRVDPLVAHVTTQLKDEGTRRSKDDGVGAGFVVGNGLIVTSRHVVSGARKVVVTFPDADPVLAEVAGVDDATDTAVLRIPGAPRPALATGSSHALRKGDRVLAVGSPFHLANSWSAGIVSGLHRSGLGVNPRGYESYIQTDAAANLGNSGGPLLNAQGQVVGVVSAILSRSGGSQGIALAVPIEAVLQGVQRATGARPARPSLGLSVRAQSGRGLVVTRLDGRGPAAQAGLRMGDVLESCDGQPLRAAADLQQRVWNLPSGSTARITINRGGRRFVVNLRVP